MAAEYIVEVVFIKSRLRTNYLVGTKTSVYPFNHGNLDTFVFSKKGFTLSARRSSAYLDGTILSNDKNSLYQQIVKGLLVYYALADDFPILKNIIIKRKKSRTDDFVYSDTHNFQQPIKPGVPRKFYLPTSFADELLQETIRSQALRIAFTYWLKAMNSNDSYFRFDRLWKAYDRLLLYEGNTTREMDGFPAIKQVITNNSTCFPLSISITNSYSQSDLRSFQWNTLLASKTIGYTKVSLLVRKLTEFTDHRFIDLFQGISKGRKIQQVLVNNGLLAQVNSHYLANSTTVNDIDIVLLLSLSYTYFIRCRLFHGEVIDSTFKLKSTREDFEIGKMSELLETVLYELFCNCNILR